MVVAPGLIVYERLLDAQERADVAEDREDRREVHAGDRERDLAPGGMLRYGIPKYRMPREKLNAEIQRIAEMGSSDAERVQLHFEIRKLGKPVDPTRLLPPR